ncbi:hypothetical protein QBC33DRAFT_537230 [Phialemonium atrogriseum]|uniref:Spondin domain-containing protein n=1 Tax=Phialemonium atrogriseum TaxID=1093897 RepID=A0AAJ0C1E0_9PEZI|nr:uncharacterized protein QBC33DRAFT_537230 [Phialemonium atrogriseum]KAK1767747.1 hypothetical protein QBC33DRAFT_537230 [Phialemonium atrogriseum]
MPSLSTSPCTWKVVIAQFTFPLPASTKHGQTVGLPLSDPGPSGTFSPSTIFSSPPPHPSTTTASTTITQPTLA